jgi:hypothetical protein
MLAENPIRGFGQMPGYRPDSLLVALALGDALVEAAEVARPRALA